MSDDQQGGVSGIFENTQKLVSPRIKDALSRLSPDLSASVLYHFGWRDERGNDVDSPPGGKGMRPTLALLSAQRAGADAETGIPGAVAVELVHNFSLLHDDIIDNDAFRRHRPTVWSVFGVSEAIIGGDALLSLAFEVLLEQKTNSASAASLSLAKATTAMIEGQRADMGMDSAEDMSLERCQKMEAMKTGALLACSASIGAILADASEEIVDSLHNFGMELGLAFQAVDDYLGIWGDSEITGKPVGNDIKEKKKSLPVAIAISEGQGSAVLEAYSKGEMSPKEVQAVIDILNELDCAEKTRKMADEHLNKALESLGMEDDPVLENFREIARFATKRNF